MLIPDSSLEQTLLFIDNDIVAVNKPPGLRVIPDGYQVDLPNLTGMLKLAYGRVWVVHRLDRDTSGVILFARNPGAHRQLNLQFQNRQVHKTYHALARGLPPWEEMNIHAPLRVDGDRQHRTVQDSLNGKPAETDLHVIERFAHSCLIEARPHTGYTHQIRAHLAFAGFPLLADRLYDRNQPAPSPILERVGLHARGIQFCHPCLNLAITLDAPYPPDFTNALALLRGE